MTIDERKNNNLTTNNMVQNLLLENREKLTIWCP